MFRYEGLVFSVGGNGRSYLVILETGPSADTSQSTMYFARISTKIGFCRVSLLTLSKGKQNSGATKIIFYMFICTIFVLITFSLQIKNMHILIPHFLYQVRVPFSSFRPVKPDDPPLDPFLVHTLTIRFEPRRQVCFRVAYFTL